VLPIWLYPVLAVVLMGLSYSVWRVWSPEIRARLIPEAEIQKIAEDLIAQHGVNGAKAIALTNCQEAIQRHDLFEMARWDRIIQSLNEIIKTKQ
jgi:hypothetical protein